MNPSFNIQPAGIETSSSQLFVEAGPSGISFVILDASNCFSAVVIYSFSQGMSESAMNDQFHKIFAGEDYLQRSFKKINIAWTFNQSILTPADFFDSNSSEQALNLVFGDLHKGVIRSDFMYRQNIHNVYRIPQWAIDALPSSLQFANQSHQYSLLPGMNDQTDNCLLVIFYKCRLTVMLTKARVLQVIQQFEYDTADDAAWHLLNICQSFDIMPDETLLQLYGMIDTESKLYANLYKYFLQIELAGLPTHANYSDAIKEYPPHFFSHLFTKAS